MNQLKKEWPRLLLLLICLAANAWVAHAVVHSVRFAVWLRYGGITPAVFWIVRYGAWGSAVISVAFLFMLILVSLKTPRFIPLITVAQLATLLCIWLFVSYALAIQEIPSWSEIQGHPAAKALGLTDESPP